MVFIVKNDMSLSENVLEQGNIFGKALFYDLNFIKHTHQEETP